MKTNLLGPPVRRPPAAENDRFFRFLARFFSFLAFSPFFHGCWSKNELLVDCRPWQDGSNKVNNISVGQPVCQQSPVEIGKN
jgi:hypothetical protein